MRSLRTILFAIPSLVGLTLSCNYAEPVTPSSAGTLNIRTRTVGADIDENGYTVRLDGGASVPIGYTADLTLVALKAGEHSLMLDGVASNCKVMGKNPQSVTVLTDLTANVVLEVACTPSRGFLEIATATSGELLDSDGYDVAINARAAGTVSDQASPLRIFTAAGTKEVSLSGIAANCHVRGENPRQVAVTPPNIAKAEFHIECLPLPRTKIVFERTSGPGTDIWVMNADGSSPQNLTFNLFDSFTPSWSPDGTRILFTMERNLGGPVQALEHDIAVMSSIGSNPTILRTGELNPTAWSPDGQKIIFTRRVSPLGEPQGPQIYLMNADGTGETMLTKDILSSDDPAWSPDGSRIAFTRDNRIFVMSADGSSQRALTGPGPAESDGQARWSPDGSRLAFLRAHHSVDQSVQNLWTIRWDGSDPRRLTNPDFSGNGPFGWVGGYSWSPGGERLTFTDGVDLYTVRNDGSDTINLTNSPGQLKFEPSWSPDGGRILYTGAVGSTRDIFVVDVSNLNVINLTNGTGPDWVVRAMWQP